MTLRRDLSLKQIRASAKQVHDHTLSKELEVICNLIDNLARHLGGVIVDKSDGDDTQ